MTARCARFRPFCAWQSGEGQTDSDGARIVGKGQRPGKQPFVESKRRRAVWDVLLGWKGEWRWQRLCDAEDIAIPAPPVLSVSNILSASNMARFSPSRMRRTGSPSQLPPCGSTPNPWRDSATILIPAPRPPPSIQQPANRIPPKQRPPPRAFLRTGQRTPCPRLEPWAPAHEIGCPQGLRLKQVVGLDRRERRRCHVSRAMARRWERRHSLRPCVGRPAKAMELASWRCAATKVCMQTDRPTGVRLLIIAFRFRHLSWCHFLSVARSLFPSEQNAVEETVLFSKSRLLLSIHPSTYLSICYYLMLDAPAA